MYFVLVVCRKTISLHSKKVEFCFNNLAFFSFCFAFYQGYGDSHYGESRDLPSHEGNLSSTPFLTTGLVGEMQENIVSNTDLGL